MVYSAGLSVYVREVLSTGIFWQIYVPIYLLLLLGVYNARRWMTKPDDMPAPLIKLSILNIVPFVRSRYDFLNWGFQSTGKTVFRFRLFNKWVVAISGESGRSAFLTAKGFDIHPGTNDLLGGVSLSGFSIGDALTSENMENGYFTLIW